jgi:putative ABC transport system permease protein
MKIYRNIKISRKILVTHKLRTILALAGISIGIAAVIIVIALGEGAESEIIKQIEAMGTNLLIIHAGEVKINVGRIQNLKTATSLKIRDAEKIIKTSASVTLIAPVQDKNLSAKYGNYTTLTKILGTTEDYLKIRNFSLEQGRIFSSEENRAAVRVAVIGSYVRENLFGQENPLGKIIRVRNIPFKIVGLLKAKGSSIGGGNQDNQIIIPIRTALRRVFNLNYLKTLYVQVQSRDMMSLAESEIRKILREQHRLNRGNKADDFTIQNQLRIIQVERETRSSFTLLVTGIATISLFIGGIGILAVMFLSIKERTNEIGLRIAVGAKTKDIMLQFLSEATILGLVGGLLGLLVGILCALIIEILTQWHIKISIEPILFAIIFSMSVGLFFGTYPARKASLMDPIEALHAE